MPGDRFGSQFDVNWLVHHRYLAALPIPADQ
jgi:hypothetical protein